MKRVYTQLLMKYLLKDVQLLMAFLFVYQAAKSISHCYKFYHLPQINFIL